MLRIANADIDVTVILREDRAISLFEFVRGDQTTSVSQLGHCLSTKFSSFPYRLHPNSLLNRRQANGSGLHKARNLHGDVRGEIATVKAQAATRSATTEFSVVTMGPAAGSA